MSYRPNPNGQGKRPQLKTKYNRIMAKSKSGGTRSYIRGRVGADVYSIGKDAKGSKQQVVRSLAETVANPQTEAQMRGRMIMSTVMQMVSAGSYLWDHAFDGYPVGQPSISRFITVNYALIKADVAAHPSENNNFALNAYKEKGTRGGKYQISEGYGPTVNTAIIDETNSEFYVMLSAQNHTLGRAAEVMGINKGDFITLCGIGYGMASGKPTFFFIRVKIKDDADLTTELTSENVNTLFVIESNCEAEATLDGNTLKIAGAMAQGEGFCAGAIISTKVADGWQHGTNFMKVAADFDDYCADAILPTYPIGEELILNGGEV